MYSLFAQEMSIRFPHDLVVNARANMKCVMTDQTCVSILSHFLNNRRRRVWTFESCNFIRNERATARSKLCRWVRLFRHVYRHV
jgi:hypothetical protein